MTAVTHDPAYVAALENRTAALERQNRLLRRLSAGCFGLLAVAAACGAQVVADSLVVQEEFLVKDRGGVTRFEMVVNRIHGRSNGFHVVDANGRTRIDIGVTDEGVAVIGFFDAAGQLIKTLP